MVREKAVKRWEYRSMCVGGGGEESRRSDGEGKVGRNNVWCWVRVRVRVRARGSYVLLESRAHFRCSKSSCSMSCVRSVRVKEAVVFVQYSQYSTILYSHCCLVCTHTGAIICTRIWRTFHGTKAATESISWLSHENCRIPGNVVLVLGSSRPNMAHIQPVPFQSLFRLCAEERQHR